MLLIIAEVGDYDTREHGPNYLQDFKFCPKQVLYCQCCNYFLKA